MVSVPLNGHPRMADAEVQTSGYDGYDGYDGEGHGEGRGALGAVTGKENRQGAKPSERALQWEHTQLRGTHDAL